MTESKTLAENKIFAHMDADTISRVKASASHKSYSNDDWIVHHGDVWPNLFYVSSGQVTAIMESPEGRSLTLATISEGDIFWGLAFFMEDAPMPAALKTTGDCELLIWSQDDLMPFILESGRLSWELSRLVIQRVQFASEIVEKLAFQPLTDRVARMLLDQFPTDQNVVHRHLTLDEMASRVGTTREMVCRILYRFAEAGAIEVNRTEIVFKNRNLLDQYTQNSP